MRKSLIVLLLCLTASCGFSPSQCNDPEKITSINILDRNGMSETISSKDRLNAFENTDFLAPQPYQKVIRVYGREKNGDIHSCITSYHPNGQIKQCLAAVNNRALGSYREWYPNGQMKVDATVIGGTADINTSAEESWLFDGVNRAWNEDGNLIVEIFYSKGELEGESVYYHPNQQVWKVSPYEKGLLHGRQKIYLDDGSLFQTLEYIKGIKEGVSVRYWPSEKIAYQEHYENDRLKEACYYSQSGDVVSQIHDGNGFRAIFGKKQLQELREYRGGVQEGKVKVFDECERLARVYSVKNGEKHGEEIDYFPSTTQPKLLLTWCEGALQGSVKTWYENGNLESQKEMGENKKHGLLTAWYYNGALMLVEEYDTDKLLKGEYFRIGESIPISKIEKGKGVATLFNSDGNFSKKVHYDDGKPLE